MNIMDIKTIIPVQDFESFLVYFEKYRTYFLIGLLLFAGMIGGGIYWYFYSINYAQSAQQAFSELVLEYKQTSRSPELWPEVEMMAKTIYKQYSRSALVPFFLAFQVEALLAQQKHEEALAVMKMMLQKLSVRSPVYNLYMLKEARMKLDSTISKIQEDGLQQLTLLANDKNNICRDQALYYLGLYYEKHDQKDKAREYWQHVETMRAPSDQVQSPWVLLVDQQRAQGDA